MVGLKQCKDLNTLPTVCHILIIPLAPLQSQNSIYKAKIHTQRASSLLDGSMEGEEMVLNHPLRMQGHKANV